MNRNDINRLFTQEVSNLLAQGFQIHTSTMGGSQGEIAHIDLFKGTEVLRVLLDRGNDWRAAYGEVFRIAVGRNTERLHNGWDDTIWNNRLEILSEIKLTKVTDTYFCTSDKAEAMSKKCVERWRAKETEPRKLGDAYKSAALGWIRRQPRMKSCKLSEVETMTRHTDDDGHIRYEIKARGNRFMLRFGKA